MSKYNHHRHMAKKMLLALAIRCSVKILVRSTVEKEGIYVTNTGLMVTYGVKFILTN